MFDFFKSMQEIKIEATGGFAIYLVFCTVFVTVIGMYQIIKWLWKAM